MINPMDWLEILLTAGFFLVTITAVIIGNKYQLQAHKEATVQQLKAIKEATSQQLDALAKSHRREMEILQVEAKECRERIDNLLTLMARRQPVEKD